MTNPNQDKKTPFPLTPLVSTFSNSAASLNSILIPELTNIVKQYGEIYFDLPLLQELSLLIQDDFSGVGPQWKTSETSGYYFPAWKFLVDVPDRLKKWGLDLTSFKKGLKDTQFFDSKFNEFAVKHRIASNEILKIVIYDLKDSNIRLTLNRPGSGTYTLYVVMGAILRFIRYSEAKYPEKVTFDDTDKTLYLGMERLMKFD